MCDGERNSRLKKSVEATANRTEGRGTKIGVSAPEPTVSPAPLSIGGAFRFNLSLLQIFPHCFGNEFLKCPPLINCHVLEGLDQINR